MRSSIGSSDPKYGLNRDFIPENLLHPQDPNKIIAKHLLEMILTPEKVPLQLLADKNPLTHYLRHRQPTLIDTFIDSYHKAQVFKLTLQGSYCGLVDDKNYIIFSEGMVSYIGLARGGDRWGGFSYRVGVSVYVGDFYEMKSDGRGVGVFLEGGEGGKGGDVRFHEMEGFWRRGEIEKGTRKTYKNSMKEPPILQYTGKFKNFKFEDQNGKLIVNNKEFVGKFNKGEYMGTGEDKVEGMLNQLRISDRGLGFK